MLQEFLVHILSPVYRITEDDTVRDERMGKHLESLLPDNRIHMSYR